MTVFYLLVLVDYGTRVLPGSLVVLLVVHLPRSTTELHNRKNEPILLVVQSNTILHPSLVEQIPKAPLNPSLERGFNLLGLYS